MFDIWIDKGESLNISYGLTESLSSLCSVSHNAESWEKVDCAGSCVKYDRYDKYDGFYRFN